MSGNQRNFNFQTGISGNENQRFALPSEVEVKEMILKKNAKNTDQNTSYALRILKDFCTHIKGEKLLNFDFKMFTRIIAQIYIVSNFILFNSDFLSHRFRTFESPLGIEYVNSLLGKHVIKITQTKTNNTNNTIRQSNQHPLQILQQQPQGQQSQQLQQQQQLHGSQQQLPQTSIHQQRQTSINQNRTGQHSAQQLNYELFIETVHKFGCIWDVRLASIKEQTARKFAWKRIQEVVGDHFTGYNFLTIFHTL